MEKKPVKSYLEFINESKDSPFVAISNIRKNIMGTTSFDLKLKDMRKPQDFIVYPSSKASNEITIQSDKRIGKINITNGKGKMSQNHASGAYFHHLNFDKLTEFELSPEDLEKLVSFLKSTATAKAGVMGISSDNSAAGQTTNEDRSNLRSVKVTYSNGDIITTDMAAHLTDKEIKDYFKIGKVFNIGSGEDDLLAKVKEVEILK